MAAREMGHAARRAESAERRVTMGVRLCARARRRRYSTVCLAARALAKFLTPRGGC